MCYADDTVLNFCGNNWNEAISNTKSELIKMELWLEDKNLFLNLKKSCTYGIMEYLLGILFHFFTVSTLRSELLTRSCMYFAHKISL